VAIVGKLNYFLFLQKHVEVTKLGAFASGKPMLLHDGTLLTPEYDALTDNGMTQDLTRSLCPVAHGLGTTRKIRNSSIYYSLASDGTVLSQKLHTVYDQDGVSKGYYSNDGGISWSPFGTKTNVRIFFTDKFGRWTIGNAGNTIECQLDAGSTYSSSSFGTIYPESFSNVVFTDMGHKVFSIGTYVVMHLTTTAFSGVTNFSSGYGGRNANFEHPNRVGIMGHWPILYIILATSPHSTSTAYIHKLTSGSTSTSAASWLWTEYAELGVNPMVSETIGEWCFISTNTKIWRFNVVTGKIHLVRYNAVAGAVMETIGHAGHSGMPYYTYNDTVDTFKSYEENMSAYLAKCKSYHYINAYPSNAEIKCNRDTLRRFATMSKCVMDIFYEDYEIYPAAFDFKDIPAGSNPIISGVTYSGWTSVKLIDHIMFHKKVLQVTEFQPSSSSVPFYGELKLEIGSAGFDHGTVSFYFYACSYSIHTSASHLLQILDSSNTVGASVDVTANRYWTAYNAVEHPYDEMHYAQFDFECRSGGSYRYLSQYKYHFRIDGRTIVNSGTMSNNITQVTSLRLIHSTNTFGIGSTFLGLLDGISTESDHPFWNQFRGYLGFRGYVGKMSLKNREGTLQLDGIDKELSKNSHDIVVSKQNSRALIQTLVNGMSQIRRLLSIDPHGSFNTKYYRDYASMDYATIYD